MILSLMRIVFVYNREENMVIITTPPVNLPIELELLDGSPINTSLTFEYRNDPNFTDIAPTNHLTV